MRIRLLALLVLAGALLTWPVPAFAQDEPAAKIELKILYAGHPASEREKDFVHFLGKYFVQVKTSDLAKFADADARGFDVVLMDYDGEGFNAPRPRIGRNYARPTVTIGVAGAMIAGNLGLKTGYM